MGRPLVREEVPTVNPRVVYYRMGPINVVRLEGPGGFTEIPGISLSRRHAQAIAQVFGIDFEDKTEES